MELEWKEQDYALPRQFSIFNHALEHVHINCKWIQHM